VLIREKLENNEKAVLSEFAVISSKSRGRERAETECEMRTCFQRDCGRITHSTSFRRLKHKTQVFLAPEGDHYRTRLTHTLEVSQIAEAISTAKFLNTDLTRAIALGHDLGHTPFGHAGERVLNKCVPGGFRHYEQSIRVVSLLEKNGRGLNLSAEVLDGILNHTKDNQPYTLEGQIVRLADRIAFINHDIDDAIRAGVLKPSDIPKSITDILGSTKSKRIDTLIRAVVNEEENEIIMPQEIEDAFLSLYNFMFDEVYTNPVAKSEEGKAENMLLSLYEYFTKNKDKLPDDYSYILENEGTEIAAKDYIAGMSDRYSVYMYECLNVPMFWGM